MPRRSKKKGESSSTSHNDYAPSPWESRELGGPEVLSVTIELLSCYERQKGMVRSMAAGKDGRLYTLATESSNIRFWNRGKPAEGFHAVHEPNHAILLLNTGGGIHIGGRIHVGSSDGRVRIWGVTPTDPPKFKHLQKYDLPCLEESRKEKIWKKNIKVLERSARDHWRSFPVTCMSFSEVNEGSPTYLYTGSTDCSIKVWSLRDWTLVDVLQEHKRPVNSVAAGCEGRMFSASEDGSVVMWLRVQKGTGTNDVSHTVVDTLLSGLVSVDALFLKSTTTGFATKAGRGELYAGLADGKVLVWKEIFNFSKRVLDMESLHGHEGGVTCLAGSPGHLVFSGGVDGKICAWSSENSSKMHALMMVLNAHVDRLNCIAAQEDWKTNKDGCWSCILYSGSEGKMLKTWRILYRLGNVLPGH